MARDTDPRASEAALREMYLELLKPALMGEFGDLSERLVEIEARGAFKQAIQRLIKKRGLTIAVPHRENRQHVQEGRIWPLEAVTMVGRARLDNLQRCIEDVISADVPGDCIETGVWRGGASIFARAVLNAHGELERRVWVADSFQGLPPPDPRYPADAGGQFHIPDQLRVSLEQVKANFARFGLLDNSVVFLKGWFKDTLPGTSDETWSVIRLDGDMYQSTTDALDNLYPNLSVGGWAIIDDYQIAACAEAVHDFREQHDITEPLQEIDWTGVCWRRER
jgi:O-methyltransferase